MAYPWHKERDWSRAKRTGVLESYSTGCWCGSGRWSNWRKGRSRRGPRSKNILVRIHHRGVSDRHGDQRANATNQGAREVEKKVNNQQAKDRPPVPRDHLAADLHRFPETKLLIDD